MLSELTRTCKVAQHPRESAFHYCGGVELPRDDEYADLASRIEHIANETFGGNKSEMGRKIGAGSPGTIGNWIARNDGMHPSFAFYLQDHYGWSARWILEGVLPRRREVTHEEAEALFQEILALPSERRKAWLLLIRSSGLPVFPPSGT
jgi:hypothetical protein